MQEPNGVVMPHCITMENRNKLTVSGVTDVDSFDEDAITAYTDYGELTISGKNLHIVKLNTDNGELLVEGDVFALVYAEQAPKNSGFFSKMFR